MKITGITSKLKKVEVMSPPITTMAMGERKLGSTPQPRAMGNMPAPMAMVVMMMGRARLWQASSRASQRVMAWSRRAMMAYSTNKIEFLVATPINMIRPIIDGIEMAVWVMNSAKNAPGIDNTSAAKIVTGCTKSLNNSTNTI